MPLPRHGFGLRREDEATSSLNSPAETATIRRIDSGKVTSAELLARRIYGAKVVRAFSSITSGDQLTDARPIGSPERRAIPLAGEDAAAKSIVPRFVSEIGFDSLDVGGLSQERKFEADLRVFGAKLNLAARAARLSESVCVRFADSPEPKSVNFISGAENRR